MLLYVGSLHVIPFSSFKWCSCHAMPRRANGNMFFLGNVASQQVKHNNKGIA